MLKVAAATSVVAALDALAFSTHAEDLAGRLDGRIVIDTCNPFPGRDGEIATRAREKGVGLASAELLPGARIVRTFNAFGAARMASAHEQPGRIAGEHAPEEIRRIAATLE